MAGPGVCKTDKRVKRGTTYRGGINHTTLLYTTKGVRLGLVKVARPFAMHRK